MDSRLVPILDGLPLSSNKPRRNVNSPQIHNWNFRYDGGSGLSSFLGRTQELSQARGISDDQLFKSAVELLQGDALTWFKARSSRLHTWEELVAALKLTFLPYDYECDLWNEIRNRTQGSDEPVSISIAKMMGLFNRLPTKSVELEIVRLIRQNLLPSLQQRLGVEKIESIYRLEELCHQLEDIEWRTRKFKPPPTRS